MEKVYFMLNRIVPVLERIFPETQNGFRSDRGTIDPIFSLSQLEKKRCFEQNQNLYIVFIDISEANA